MAAVFCVLKKGFYDKQPGAGAVCQQIQFVSRILWAKGGKPATICIIGPLIRRDGQAVQDGMPAVAVRADVGQALAAVGEVTGWVVREDVTARIFERFCVGE